MDVTLTAEGRNVKCHKVKLVLILVMVGGYDGDGGYDGGVGYDGDNGDDG